MEDYKFHHKCKKCGYVIPSTLYFAAAFDYPCPRCGQQQISYFETITLFEENEKLEN